MKTNDIKFKKDFKFCETCPYKQLYGSDFQKCKSYIKSVQFQAPCQNITYK